MTESFVSVARRIQSDPSLVQNEPLPVVHTEQEATDQINYYRPEMYALLSIVAVRVVEDAIGDPDKRQAHRIADDIAGVFKYTTMEDLSTSLNKTLQASRKRTLEAMRQSEGAPIVSRLDQLVGMLTRVFENTRYKDVDSLVAAGLATSSYESGRGLSAVNRLVLEKHPGATNEEIATIARRSNIFIKRMASLNLLHLDIIKNKVGSAGYRGRNPGDTQFLALKTGAEGREFVDFTAAIRTIEDSDNGNLTVEDMVEARFRTLGCPATAKLEGPSPINRVWDWAVDMAEAEGLFG